jgi:hypothetical protein
MPSWKCRTCSTADPQSEQRRPAPIGRCPSRPDATERPMTDRWSEADANAWWRARPWLCGFNFLPSTAVNFIEMWHRDSFDAATIERELGWAAGLGFNAFRINLHYLVWKHDRDGLLDRLDRVMGMGPPSASTPSRSFSTIAASAGPSRNTARSPTRCRACTTAGPWRAPGARCSTTVRSVTVSNAMWPTSSGASAPTRGSRSGISTTNPATG